MKRINIVTLFFLTFFSSTYANNVETAAIDSLKRRLKIEQKNIDSLLKQKETREKERITILKDKIQENNKTIQIYTQDIKKLEGEKNDTINNGIAEKIDDFHVEISKLDIENISAELEIKQYYKNKLESTIIIRDSIDKKLKFEIEAKNEKEKTNVFAISAITSFDNLKESNREFIDIILKLDIIKSKKDSLNLNIFGYNYGKLLLSAFLETNINLKVDSSFKEVIPHFFGSASIGFRRGENDFDISVGPNIILENSQPAAGISAGIFFSKGLFVSSYFNIGYERSFFNNNFPTNSEHNLLISAAIHSTNVEFLKLLRLKATVLIPMPLDDYEYKREDVYTKLTIEVPIGKVLRF